MSKVEKVHISGKFLLITFFGIFFKTFSMDLKSARNSAFFDIFFDLKKKFQVILVLFSNFEADTQKMAPKNHAN